MDDVFVVRSCSLTEPSIVVFKKLFFAKRMDYRVIGREDPPSPGDDELFCVGSSP